MDECILDRYMNAWCLLDGHVHAIDSHVHAVDGHVHAVDGHVHA